MRQSVTVLAFIVAASNLAWGQFGGGNGPGMGGIAVQGPSLKLLQALEKPIDYDFVDMPLEDVVRLLQMNLEFPVLLDEVSLSEMGIDKQDPLSFSLSGNSTSTVLDLMLKPLRLGYVCRGDVLQITSIDIADQALYVQFFDVGDLLVQGTEVSELEQLLTTTLPGASWDPHHIEGGNLQVINNVLVVTHNLRVQQSVKSLLEGLQSLQAARQPDPEALVVKVYRVDTPVGPTISRAKFPENGAELQEVSRPSDPEALPNKLVTIIHSSIAPGSWGLDTEADQPALWSVPGAVVVRAKPSIQAEVRTFLKPFSPTAMSQIWGHSGYVPSGVGLGNGDGFSQSRRPSDHNQRQ